jgi:hypothetical protein
MIYSYNLYNTFLAPCRNRAILSIYIIIICIIIL